MARQARIIATLPDAWGGMWDIRQIVETPHGDIMQGWPQGLPRGRGGSGGPSWVITPVLKALIDEYRVNTSRLLPDLPFGRHVLKRLRKALGYSRDHTIRELWTGRIGDLANLTLRQCADRHEVSTGTVEYWRTQLMLPPKQLEDKWYLQEPHRSRLASTVVPLSWLADNYGLSIRTIQQLRHTLRVAHGDHIPDRRGEVRGGRHTTRRSRWDNVDWSLRDTDIATQMGVSRQRVWQVRHRAGFGEPPDYGQTGPYLRARDWLLQHPEAIRVLSVPQIAGRINTLPATVYRVAEDYQLRLLRNRPARCSVLPINWRLPNKDIARIWQYRNPQTVCTIRSQRQFIRPEWHPLMSERLHPDYYRARNAEAQRARRWLARYPELRLKSPTT